MKKLLSALLGASFLSASAFAQTTPPPAPAPVPAVAAKVMADPALWVVKDEDTTIYLFGTIHLLKPEIEWFDGGVKKAYDASSEVVLELIEPDPATMQALIGKIGVDPDGPPLTTKLGPDAAAYVKVATDLGLPAPQFETLEPWLVATVLSVTSIVKAGLNPENGVEKQLTLAVKRDGKTLGALETAEQQLGFFDSLPEAAQIAFLKQTVAEMPEVKKMFDAMMVTWEKGDPDGLAVLMNAGMGASPEVFKALLTDRNERWAEWIQTRLAKPGTVFLAVGAGHLAGKDSVQAFLKGRKIKAVRIPS